MLSSMKPSGQKIGGKGYSNFVTQHQMRGNPAMGAASNLLLTILQSNGIQQLLTRWAAADQTFFLV